MDENAHVMALGQKVLDNEVSRKIVGLIFFTDMLLLLR
jgi:ribose 5-phosphate isomerase RpiB